MRAADDAAGRRERLAAPDPHDPRLRAARVHRRHERRAWDADPSPRQQRAALGGVGSHRGQTADHYVWSNSKLERIFSNI